MVGPVPLPVERICLIFSSAPTSRTCNVVMVGSVPLPVERICLFQL